MKLIHLGDLHLGKNVNEFSMIEDQKYILRQIIEMAKQYEVDAVLIAGDVYDRSVPSEEAVRLLDSFLTSLYQMGKSVFVISGNHDSDERLHFGSRLLQENGIYIVGKYEGEVACVTLEDTYGPVHVWMLPYVKASRVAHYFPKEDTSTYDAAVRTVLQSCEVNTKERNVIVLHQFVSGKSEPELAGSESATVSVGMIDRIGYDCFDAFDYAAMGHIHGGQAVGRETCRYAGAPLKYSLHPREVGSTKTVPLVTLEEKGNVQVELLSLKPMREVRQLRGRLRDLLENAVDTEDYVAVTLTDEATQFDAMARIREVYPNAMKLEYDNSSTRALQQEYAVEVQGKSFQELMGEFYQFIHGCEPSEAEWNLLNEVAKEAGVIE